MRIKKIQKFFAKLIVPTLLLALFCAPVTHAADTDHVQSSGGLEACCGYSSDSSVLVMPSFQQELSYTISSVKVFKTFIKDDNTQDHLEAEEDFAAGYSFKQKSLPLLRLIQRE